MNKFDPKARRLARRLILQALYQLQFNHCSSQEVETQFIEDNVMEKVDVLYFQEVLHGIAKNKDAIDAIIKPCLDRPLEDLTPIELSVLRIAVYELKHRLDIPYKVIINEALELTKTFGVQDGYKYVNGILDKLAKELRKVEIKS